MKMSEFLEANRVSYYKATQLAGKDPFTYTGVQKSKLTGKKSVSPGELASLCQAIGQFLKTDCRPDMFEQEVERVRLK